MQNANSRPESCGRNRHRDDPVSDPDPFTHIFSRTMENLQGLDPCLEHNSFMRIIKAVQFVQFNQ